MCVLVSERDKECMWVCVREIERACVCVSKKDREEGEMLWFYPRSPVAV